MTTDIDITPARLRCGSGFCPTVNYTPAHLRCAYTGSCPEVAGKDGVLTIVGKHIVGHPKVGLGEAAVEIGEEYFSELPEVVRLREALVEISGSAGLGGPWCAAKARSALGDFGCQASGLQGGEAVSPSALHPGAGGQAENQVTEGSGCVWCDLGFPIVSVNSGPGHVTKDGVIYFCGRSHENPPRTAEDQSTAIAQPPEASSHQKPT